jgi:hypothetical protein
MDKIIYNNKKKVKKFKTLDKDNMISNIPGSWDKKKFNHNIDTENKFKFNTFDNNDSNNFVFNYEKDKKIKKDNINMDVSNQFRNGNFSRLENFHLNKKLEQNVNNRFDYLLSNPQIDNSALQLRDDYLYNNTESNKNENEKNNNDEINKYHFKY